MREVAVIAGWKIPAPVPPITVDPEPTKMADEGAEAFSQIFQTHSRRDRSDLSFLEPLCTYKKRADMFSDVFNAKKKQRSMVVAEKVKVNCTKKVAKLLVIVQSAAKLFEHLR